MFVELIDRLRCLNPHADCCLVATVTHAVDRHIVEGTLGCPLCGAEYPIRERSVCFGGEEPGPAIPARRFTEGGPIRLAAMLAASEHGGLYVLEGPWSIHAPGIADQFPGARLVTLASPEVEGAGARLRGTSDAIPLAAACARGVALGRNARALVDAAVRVLGTKGRLVVPNDTPVPDGITVLARDDDWCVGEREPGATAPAPISPRRAAPRTGSR